MPNAEDTARDYHIAVHDDPRAIDARAWNGLLAAQAAPTPFMRHEYLAALHASGSAVPTTGWTPRFVLLARGSTLHAACALYAKAHSYGEYVFDWAWADAHRRLGLAYYPKLLAAVPFTPVAGTRLLARDEAARRALAQAGWLLRHGVQFHWQARAVAPAGDFAGFLAALQRDKRKKIAQERRRIAEQGIGFTVHEGEAIDAPLWDFFHHCYTLTYRAHHGTPYLTRAFFAQVAASMPRNWLMFVAREGSGGPLAAALVALDPERRSAYGRYWGAVRQVPGLHFEACYYQPLAWCIAKGWIRFEGGAQGEHKMARGLLPVRTTSAHWLRDARLAQAVQRFLAAEDAGVEAYVDELRARTPFRSGEG